MDVLRCIAGCPEVSGLFSAHMLLLHRMHICETQIPRRFCRILRHVLMYVMFAVIYYIFLPEDGAVTNRNTLFYKTNNCTYTRDIDPSVGRYHVYVFECAGFWFGNKRIISRWAVWITLKNRNMMENKSLCCRMFSFVFDGRLCEGVGKMHAQSVSQSV